MSLKELVDDCVAKMKGPYWHYELHPRSVELDCEHFSLSNPPGEASSPEEIGRIKELQKRYAYPDTLPGLLKEHFPVYVRRLYRGEGIDSDSSNTNLQDTKNLFSDFAIEYNQQNINQFLANLITEFNNIPDREILNLLKSKLP